MRAVAAGTAARVATTPIAAMPRARPTIAAPSVSGVSPVRSGAWRVEEANAQVGTIVWTGPGFVSSGRNAIEFVLHKETVGGRAVSPCERETTLRALLNTRVSVQTVPYREVNCSGATSVGEMRVTGFSGDAHSFSGSFWIGGTKLGDFTANSS